MDKMIRLLIAGGFLGAGKTTLIYELTKRYMKAGKHVGIITNDISSDLVDTAFLLQTNSPVKEVTGNCFCCNYYGFLKSIKELKKDFNADIIIAEPIGSCADLSATIIQPLKKNLEKDIIISPYFVLADPLRLSNILEGGTGELHPNVTYIFKKQLEEADIIVISKSDLLNYEELEFIKEKVKISYPDSLVLSLSSKTGEGIDEFINTILNINYTGTRVLDINYDIYAEGEAAFGWLNSSINLKGNKVTWNNFMMNFLKELSHHFDSFNINVGHVKIIIKNDNQCVIGNITGRSETIQIRGDGGISNNSQMIINARVNTTPENLDRIIKEILKKIVADKIEITVNNWKCVVPKYPKPIFRLDDVVDK